MLLLATTSKLLAYLALVAACCVAGALVNSIIAVLQEVVADAQRGRLMSTLAVLTLGLPGLLGFAFGAVAAALDARNALFACIIGALGTALLVFLRPDRSEAQAALP